MSLSNDPNDHLGRVNLVQLAETEEEKNDVIIRWIKSQVDHHCQDRVSSGLTRGSRGSGY